MSAVEKLIDKKISQAIVKFNMIEPGDRILVALSGGKDSMTLAYFLNKKSGSRFHIPFEIHAVHIKNDFAPSGDATNLSEHMESLGVPHTIVSVPVTERLKEGRKMNCFWCASQRRMELMEFARKHGYNKIALGHHMDDILETFFMNMAYKGEMSAMLPVLKYDNYDQTLIRPMALVKEKDVISFCEEENLYVIPETCPYGHKSKRKDMREVISFMADGDDKIRDNLFKALSNPNYEYMMGTNEKD